MVRSGAAPKIPRVHLRHAFYRFPFQFDVARLRQEIDAVPEAEWCPHPEGFKGNSALPLISTLGGMNDDFETPMRPTRYLAAFPYLQQVLAQFQTVLGRARLMRLDAEANVPAHIDIHYHWRTHTRVHIPVMTHPDVDFYCGDMKVNMAEGEAWTFDTWRMHHVVNRSPAKRIHLVFDTFGSSAFWKLAQPLGENVTPRFVPFTPGAPPKLSYESRPQPLVMAPGDVDHSLQSLVDDAAALPTNDRTAIALLTDTLLTLRQDWRAQWFAAEPDQLEAAPFAFLTARASGALQHLPANFVLGSNRFAVLPVVLSTFRAMLSNAARQKLQASAAMGGAKT